MSGGLGTTEAMRRNMTGSVAAVMLMLVSVTAWAAYAPLSGAVVAPAVVSVEGSIKKIQHQAGGIVEALHVREGQRINIGDPLLRLDDALIRANLGVILNEVRAAHARLVRLKAERDGRLELNFHEYGIQWSGDTIELKELLQSERVVFETRLKVTRGQKLQFRERIAQLLQEIEGLRQQLAATNEQLRVGQAELKDLEMLLGQGLAQRTRVTTLQKEVLRNEGTAGELKAKIAQAKGRISEIELQIIQVDQDILKEVARDIREAETRLGEQMEKRGAVEDQLKRTLIKAPESGFVHQLSVHTIGGVVGPGEQILLIVPTETDLIIEARISAQDIDQIKQGQRTRVRFPALASQMTQEIEGEVYRVGADLTKEAATGQSYFTAGIRLPVNEISKLDGFRLLPGMPAEAFIKTGERTFGSYLVKPILDQLHRAMREK